MKKLLALLLALAMLFTLAACGGKENEDREEETTEAPQPATVEEALANTAAEIEAADNMTIKLNAQVTSAGENVMASGFDISVNADVQLHCDQEAKELSAIAKLNISGIVQSYIIHEGNLVTYDADNDAYYKTDISETLDTVFDSMGKKTTSPEEALDQLPAEVLEMIEEVIDVDKLIELSETIDTEKLNEQLNYSSTTDGDTITHTYQPEIVELLKSVMEHFEEAFVNAEDYDDVISGIDEMTKDSEFAMTMELVQIDDKIHTYRVLADVTVPDEEPVKVEITLELADIGTTEIDFEELDSILEKAVEEPTGPIMGEGSIVGMVEENSYYNQFMALCCDLDENWTVASAEEASQLLGLTAELIDAEELIEQTGVFCDFYALYSDQMSSINIMVQKETAETMALSSEEFNTLNASTIAPALEASGYTNVQVEEAIIGFAGGEYDGLLITAEAGDVILYETQVLVRFGGYAMTITAASFMEDLTGEFLNYFYCF